MQARKEDIALFVEVLDERGLIEVDRVKRCSAPCVSKVIDEQDVTSWMKVHESEWAATAEYDALVAHAPVCAQVQRVADRALLVEDLSAGEMCDVAYAPHRQQLADALARIHEAAPTSQAMTLDEHASTSHDRLVDDASLPADQLAFATDALARLVPVEAVLLHGDLTRRNMRVVDDVVRLFDPYGIAGDPAYDVAFTATMGWTEDRDTLAEQLTARYARPLDNLDAWMDWLAVYRLHVLRRLKRPADAHERHLGRRMRASALVSA